MPGKGYWAPKPMFRQKTALGAIGGSAIGASLGGKDPVTIALYGTIGLVLGYMVGDTIDKIDQLHAALVIDRTFHMNENHQTSSWRNKRGNFSVSATPLSRSGSCREFITSVMVNGKNKEMRGTACRNPQGEWIMKEAY